MPGRDSRREAPVRENLSERLANRIGDLFPESAHVNALGLGGGRDVAIWEAARTGEYTLVTKDADFQRLSLMRGHPPKIIWVRLGNCSMRAVEELLRDRVKQIGKFLDDPEAAFFALG